MKPRIYITRMVPDPVAGALSERFAPMWPEADMGPIAHADLLAAASACDGLVTMLTDRVTASVLQSGVKIVANYAAGTDNIDLETARRLGVMVTNTPGVLTDATADLAFGLLLAVARRLVEGDRFVRSGNWNGWGPTLMPGRELTGRTLGIVGLGRIGQAMARRARGFGMEVVYAGRRSAGPQVEAALDSRRVSLDTLLAESDFISLHCPLTPETHGLLDAKAFGKMRPGAILINTARGEVVDEEAMIDALAEGRLGGAGLDVFTGEPRVNTRLLELPNVVVAPHLGSATWETRTRMGMMVVENLTAFFEGKPPPNRVA